MTVTLSVAGRLRAERRKRRSGELQLADLQARACFVACECVCVCVCGCICMNVLNNTSTVSLPGEQSG